MVIKVNRPEVEYIPLVTEAAEYDEEDDSSYGAASSTEAGLHCHQNEQQNQLDKRARQKLILASALCLTFMLGEIAGGVLANSIAIATDAAHLLTDFGSFMISLFSIYIASRPATKGMSFGWHRAEVMGALVSVLLIWVVTGILVYLAVQRVIDQDYVIRANVMLITAGCGVAFNILMGVALHDTHGHGHSHGFHSHSHHHDDAYSETTYGTVVESNSDPAEINGLSRSQKRKKKDYTTAADDGLAGQPLLNAPADATITTINEMFHGDSPEVAGGGGANATSASYGHNNMAAEHSVDLESEIHDDSPRGLKPNLRRNINVHAAFIHVLGDLVQSIGVLIAAFIIYYKPNWQIADPICTFVFSVLVLITTISILRDTLNVLMEATPRGISFNEVKRCLCRIDGVRELHNLRIWSLTVNKIALSVHLAIDLEANQQLILGEAGALLREKFGVHECTVQMEVYVNEMQNCVQCQEPKD